MGTQLQNHIKSLRNEVSEIQAQHLAQSNEFMRIDVREQDEVESGLIPQALHIPKGLLEMKIEEMAPELERKIILYCAGGNRSLMAAQSLKQMGYKNIFSLSGGIKAWKDAGLPLEQKPTFQKIDIDRYRTQMRLPQVGEAGQHKLSQAKVLIIGAGGLGSPVAYYLAAAGVGTIGLMDDDVVDKSNLQRQILHTTDRIGLAKVESAKLTLQQLNPQIKIHIYQERLTEENVDRIFPQYDLIVDGCDNFQTRYLVNDACLNHGKVNVHGSVFWFQGQASVFCHADGPCYRCLYPMAPHAELAPNCADAGVLGVLPGAIGLIEATEVLKLILGAGRSLVQRLLVYDALDMEFRELKIRKDPKCPACSDRKKKLSYQVVKDECQQES